jgi:hypothetical protein
MTKFRTSIALAALVLAAPAIAYAKGVNTGPPHHDPRGDCYITHPDAAEMTLEHFVGKSAFRLWNLNHDHAGMAEHVERNPEWKAWEMTNLVCPPGACHCTEKLK